MRKPHYKRAVFADGFSVSIQANRGAYCEPRSDHAHEYDSVELGYPNRACPFIVDYAEDRGNLTGTIYGYVPVSVVRKMIEAHGGLIGGDLPPMSA